MLKSVLAIACAVAFAATLAAQEMDVDRGATPIADGGADALGDVDTGVAMPLTYTITNSGATDLTITPPVTIANETNCTVTVTAQPAGTVAPAGTTTLELDVTPTAAGAFSFDISIDNDDADENPYDWSVSGTGVTPAPEMDVARSAAAIADGSTDNIGNSTVGSGRALVYVITNSGTADLTVTTPVTISGETNCTVTVNAQPAMTIAPVGTSNLALTVTPTAAGAFSFSVSIANDDANENPYDWMVSGTGVAGGGNGDDDDEDDDEGCSAASGSGFGMLGLLGAAGVGLWVRRRRA